MKSLSKYILEAKQKLTLDLFFKYIYNDDYDSPKNINDEWEDNDSLMSNFKDPDYFLAFIKEYKNSPIILDLKVADHDDGDVNYNVDVEVDNDEAKDIKLIFYMSNNELDKMLNKYDCNLTL